MSRLLVIEDQRKLLQSLERGLCEEGYEVIPAMTGEEGYHQARSVPVDAVVLDMMLPERDGLDVLRSLRSDGFTKPILILTARDTVEDRVQGLDSGADDYLPKPFAFAELLARIRALLRRDVVNRDLCLKADDLEMNLVTRVITRGGVEIDLTRREFELLEFLLRNKNTRRDARHDRSGGLEGRDGNADQHDRRLHHAAPEEDRAARQADAHPHGARRGLCLEGWLMSRLSIRWRLTLWYGAVLTGVLAVFGTSVFLLLRRELQNRTSRALLDSDVRDRRRAHSRPRPHANGGAARRAFRSTSRRRHPGYQGRRHTPDPERSNPRSWATASAPGPDDRAGRPSTISACPETASSACSAARPPAPGCHSGSGCHVPGRERKAAR